MADAQPKAAGTPPHHTHAADELALQLLRRHAAAYARQSNWRARWQDSARFIAQHKGNITVKTSPGSEETLQVFDTTGSEAAETMAAGMITHIAPAGEQWFQLRPSQHDEGAEASWLDGCSQRMARMIHSSNFYEAGFECFHDLAAFSICALFCEEVEDSDAMPVNFVNVPVGTFVIEENRYGRVDVLMRKFEWTARQCEQRWGREALSKPMQELLLSDSGDRESRKFEILHCVYPRADYKTGKMAKADERHWASVYIDCAAMHVLEENGYYEQPFAVCRLGRGNNEIYGRGPADRAMPTIKMLQQLRRIMLLVGNKLVNPGWLLAAGAEYLIDNRPGGRFYWDASNAQNRPERVPIGERIDWAQAYIDSLRDEVRTAFYVQMFQMFTNPDEMRREKTATEVERMTQERLVLFSPIFGRTAVEFFNPMLRRLFDVMLRRRLLDTPPGGLEVLDYDVDYVSKIALAIKASQSGSLMAMAQITAQVAQFDPDAALVVDWGKSSRGVMRNLGLPVEWQRSEDEVLQIKQAAAQAAALQQMEQLAGAAQKGAAAAKNLGPDAQAAAMGALTQG